MASMMGSRASVAAPRPAVRAAVVQRRSVVVFAAADEKKKRLPQPVKRAQQAVERRMVNKSRKSATATRIKKVRVQHRRGGMKEPFCVVDPPLFRPARPSPGEAPGAAVQCGDGN